MTARSASDSPLRALLLCQDLSIAGGVERFACALAGHLAGQGIATALGSVDTPAAAVAYPVDARVRVLAARAPRTAPTFSAPSGPARVWRLLRSQWRTGRALAALIRAEQPDVVVLNGLTTACSVLLMRPGCAPRAICCDHNHFEARSRPWRLLRAWKYPKVAALVSLTEADAPKFRMLNPRTEVIPNASSLRADAPSRPGDPLVVLAIGRCVAQKGFDLLLRAWQIVAAQSLPGSRAPSRLRIVGDGPLQGALALQALQLGIADRIDWVAPTRQVEQHYREAAVFALPSRYEGMPLVLLEAQAMGVPSVAFDCPTGPAEVITGDTGLTVPPLDVPAFAQALLALLAQPALRERMAWAALQRSRECFGPQAHFERWTALVREVARVARNAGAAHA